MDDIFKNIDPEKKDRIINSALEEFSKNGFDKASTNNIVKKAGISKGLLYHYFSSKKELYEYLEKFVFETIIDAINEKLDWEESDIFERIKQIVMIKFEVADYYPYMFPFSILVVENKSIEEIKKITEDFSPELYSQIYYKNIDYTKFKDNTDIGKAVNIIRWTMEKFSEELQEKARREKVTFDYKACGDEINDYIEILKKAFYK